MTFERAWVLVFAVLPGAWVYVAWRTGSQRTALLLKAGAILCILLALAEPRVESSESKLAVPVLVDTSASVAPGDLARASELVRQLESTKGRNWMHVIAFARSTRPLSAVEVAGNFSLQPTPGESGRGTDLESAIREAMASMPEGLVPRVVLVSDGKENKGSVTRATWAARQLGVPIDVIPMSGRPKPALRLLSVSLPAQAVTGDRFPIDLTVEAPERASANLEVTAEGKQLSGSTVELHEGLNRLRIHVALNVAGAIDISGALRSSDTGEVRFAQSVTLRKPRILYVSQDPPGSEKNFFGVLTAGHFAVDTAATPDAKNLDAYQIVVLNNIDIETLPDERKVALEAYVKRGGGLLTIGGEKNTFVQDKKIEDALERALPAKLAPPRSPEGTCVVLIIDKSSSMEGRKMELARQAAVGVVDNLRPVDFVGVLIFDNSFLWAVPIRKAEDRTLIKRLISGITPDGGTQIAPALTEAYRRTLPVRATYKHIVLLTDGISEEGDSLQLSKDSAAQSITISTVGLGQDVNRSYLEKVAANARGKAYFLNDPAGLEQILLKDVLEFTGSTAIEKNIQPVAERKAEILEGVDIETAPALRGYTKYVAKSAAETVLSIDHKDPLLVRWQYGLGRSAVFASDAKSRWAEAWLTWKGYDRFWENLLRDLLPHSQAGEPSLDFDAANGDLVVSYRTAQAAEEPKAIPAIYVFGPDGFQQPVEVSRSGPGLYRGRVSIGSRLGLFRVRPLEESRIFPEVGYYRQEPELADFGSNDLLLKQIAAYTGGRYNPDVRRIFDSGGRTVASSTRLWPGLLGLAVLLNLIELVLRKWRGSFGRLLAAQPAESV